MGNLNYGISSTWLQINGSPVAEDDYAKLKHAIHYSNTHSISQTLQLSFEIGSDVPTTDTYAIMALVDWAQVPTELANQTKLVHIVSMQPMGTRVVTLTVSVPQTPGLHKVTPMIFGAAHEHTLNDLFRFSSGSQIHYLSSIDLQVGEEAGNGASTHWPSLGVDHARVNLDEPADGSFQGVSINRTPQWGNEWLFEPVRAGQTLIYAIHLGNDEISARPYAVMTFLDWLQVPMDVQGHTIFTGTIARDQRLIIDAAVKVPAGEPDPTNQHTHELLVVYIAYPWAKDSELIDNLLPETNLEALAVLNLWSTKRTALVVQAH